MKRNCVFVVAAGCLPFFGLVALIVHSPSHSVVPHENPLLKQQPELQLLRGEQISKSFKLSKKPEVHLPEQSNQIPAKLIKENPLPARASVDAELPGTTAIHSTDPPHNTKKPGNFDVPSLIPHQPLSAEAIAEAEATLNGTPSIIGIHAILTRFVMGLHDSFAVLAQRRATRNEIYGAYLELAQHIIFPLDARYRGQNIFPVREDDSIFLSLASFRDHLLGPTLTSLFKQATHPEKLYVGVVAQNCYENCKTGAQVIGKGPNGKDQTRVSDAPPDRNGVAEFCADPEMRKFCDNGHLRVLYVNETESLGPAVARYFASKLWGGETYYMQSDSHLEFSNAWDTAMIAELKAANSFPKSILSNYPAGFGGHWEDTAGPRLCTCEFSRSPVESDIIRINVGAQSNMNAPAPSQVAFIAAGFFFCRAEFLRDVPFDPLVPWCFMGEEIALSARAWTYGWDVYAPRKNLFSHQYRPGRMGLPKFWGTVGRLFGRPGFNTQLMLRVIQRIKNMVGYEDSSLEILRKNGDEVVLTDIEFYGLGTERSLSNYYEHVGIDIVNQKCHVQRWCNRGELL